MLQGKTEKAFQSAFDKAMAFCAESGLDTVFVQVRPFADALYPSDYFPYAQIITGERGKKPDFDPLAVMLRSAEQHHLSVHAWINPYRISRTGQDSFPADDPIASRKDLCSYQGKLYFNPASKSAQTLIANGVKELLTRYPGLAGIHIDDYFYPTQDPEFDRPSYEAYVKDGGKADLADFRRQQVASLCALLFQTVKACKKDALFGISPAGNLQHVTDVCYFDPAEAVKNHSVDYLCPQIYFGYHNDSQPFDSVLHQWKTLTKDSSCRLLVGLPFYKSGREDSWAGGGKKEFLTPGVLPAMTAQVLSDPETGGIAYYSLSSIMEAKGTALIDWINCKGRLTEQENRFVSEA